jgi:hypothetical protein
MLFLISFFEKKKIEIASFTKMTFKYIFDIEIAKSQENIKCRNREI